MVYVLCFLFYWYYGKVTFERSNAELKIKNENICKYTVLVRIIGTLVKHEQKQGCKKWTIVYFVCQKALFLVSSDHRSRSCVKYHYSVWQLNILKFLFEWEKRIFSWTCCNEMLFDVFWGSHHFFSFSTVSVIIGESLATRTVLIRTMSTYVHFQADF